MIALIPARGGSKGVPNKNIKKLLGKPLIAYTIEAALKSHYVKRVIVSTDDKNIAEVSIKHGAEVPFMRPAHLATDNSPALDTYLYTINNLEEQNCCSINEIMILLPTCPLRTYHDIDEAISLFNEKNADSVVSYTQEHHPIYWHRKLTKENRFLNFWDDDFLQNRQELERTYFPNGAIYIFKKQLLTARQYYGPNSFAYLMPRNRSIDIDTIDDFDLAEYYIKKHAK